MNALLRRTRGFFLLILFPLVIAQAAFGATATATYHVRVVRVAPPKLAVSATLPIDGQALLMDTSRPGDIPELDAAGWPALVNNLRVWDATGKALQVTSAGTKGWQLKAPHSGPVKVEYEVDYSLFAQRGWPAPRESAFADTDHLVIVGRSLFITTPETGSSTVTFDPPRGWRTVAPWEPTTKPAHALSAASPEDLTQNLLAFTRAEPDVMTAGGFQLLVTPMGHWQAVRPEIRKVLGGAIQQLVALMGFKERVRYSVVLLPVLDRGGEAFRHSFAMSVDTPPSAADRFSWGNTIAHEVFHYWNGSRLRGADYATSQWFQEGFTEYSANLSLLAAGLISPDDFRTKLSEHIKNYRRLTTTLEGGGTRKGPPLYSGGALVAFCWDVMIRDATEGQRNLGYFLRELWRRTEAGKRPYEWQDLQAALTATAPLDWQAFFNSYVRGKEPLPLGEILPRMGLRLEQGEDGSPRVEIDPAASPGAKALWNGMSRSATL